MVSLQFNELQSEANQSIDPQKADLLDKFKQHTWWNEENSWKHRLNNLQLIIQPYIYYYLIKPQLKMFEDWHLRIGFSWLIEIINSFIGYVPGGGKQDAFYFSSA